MKENRKLVVVVGVLLVSGLVFAAIVAAFFVSKAGPALLGSIANISTSKSGNRGEGEFKFDEGSSGGRKDPFVEIVKLMGYAADGYGLEAPRDDLRAIDIYPTSHNLINDF